MASMFLPLSYHFSHSSSASLKSDLIPRATKANIVASVSRTDERFEETKGRISKLFDKNEVSISTYDTAWVAMVPSPFSSEEPCFPDTLFWLLENQCHDGSWARPHHHSRLKKDVLLSTLACIIALKKWGVGQQHINRGLDFLELNFASTRDENQISPIGFDIIFPAMLDHAKGLSLNLNLEKTMLSDMMDIRDLERKRCYESESRPGMEGYLAYIGEGIGKLQDWESVVMKYQRKNGSLFNSPSTTAAAFMALGNSNCLNYLNILVNKFGNAVPAVYPLNIYSQLCTVDNLEKLGINTHFIMEIQNVLDQTYRCWVEEDEEILMEPATCALAFRILRMNGYNVISDPITKVIDEWLSSGHMMRDVNTTLELYKASQLAIYPHEKHLEKQTLKLRLLLEQELSSCSPQLNAEVKHALDYPFYAIMDRMAKRKAIELYNFDTTRILKTSYCSPKFGNKDFLLLSVEDYNQCQAIHREEGKEFDRWFVESRLDEVEYANHKTRYCYWTAAAAAPTIFGPEQSDARLSWAKHSVMVTVLDDLFDVRGSVEEMKNIIHLLEEWNANEISSTECCSRDVEIIFSALKSTISESVEKGSKLQGRSIRSHVISIYLDMLHCFMKEVEWRESKYIPSFDEYMSNAYVSVAVGPELLIPLYLIGPKVSEEMINHSHYQTLYKLIGTITRLLNDIRCDEREVVQGKQISALPLYMAERSGGGGEIRMSKEAAISEITTMIERQTRELVRVALEEEGSVVPKACRGLFLHMCTVVHLFYKKDDGFWSKELIQILSQILHQPILLEDIDINLQC